MKNKIIKLELEEKTYQLELSRLGIGKAWQYGLNEYFFEKKINPILLPYALFYSCLVKHHNEIDFNNSVVILDTILKEYGEEFYNTLNEKLQELLLEYIELTNNESEKERKKGKLTVI